MSLATDKKKWDDLHAALAKATEAANAYDRQLHSHYGRYETQWLKKGERAKLETLRDRQDKIGDKIVALLVQVSPRGEAWLSGVPAHWIRNDLTWEDAVRPKNEPLSVVPPTSYGNSTPIREAPMTNQDPDPEAAGAAYAQEQLSGDYFANWIHDQLLEASKMDPADVLPLETQSDAMEIAKNMLQQLKWDTSRDLDHGEISAMIGVDDATQDDVKEFFKGFRETCDMNRPWLADELLELQGEIRGGQRDVSEMRDVPGSAPIDVLRSLQPGDMVTIEARDLRKPKTVIVTEVESSRRVYVSSGKVRPGHRSGGMIYAHPGDDEVFYQATMQQQTMRVSRLTRKAAAMAEGRGRHDTHEARRSPRKPVGPTRREEIFAALWQDPKYLRLHARKDELYKMWNRADADKNTPSRIPPEELERLKKQADAAARRISDYEDEALKKAGV